MNVTRQLIAAVDATTAAASDEALKFARFCLLDWLGVALAGAHEPVVNVLASDAEAGPHLLIGRSETASLRDAVLVNGTAGHAIDYDDGMEAMMGHPSVAIMPSLFTLAATKDIDGQSLLRAITAGAEAGGRIGLMMNQDHYARGFHCTATVGAMAATIAAAKLLGLDGETIGHAIGLAGTRSAGLKASFGTDGKPLHAGWAALIALTSAQWASRGMTACDDILGHNQGFGNALTTQFTPERGLAEQAVPFVQTVSFKYHAACGITHPAIEALRKLLDQSGAQPHPFERIELRVAPGADTMCNIASPRTGLELKFSLKGVCAMTLAGVDTANPDNYDDATANDPNLRALGEKIDVVLDSNLKLGDTIMHMHDGTVRTARSSTDDFDREPIQLQQRLQAKFESLTIPLIGAQACADISGEILQSEAGPSAARLHALLRED